MAIWFDKCLYLVGVSATWILRLTLAFGLGVAFGRRNPKAKIYVSLAMIMFLCAIIISITNWRAKKIQKQI